MILHLFCCGTVLCKFLDQKSVVVLGTISREQIFASGKDSRENYLQKSRVCIRHIKRLCFLINLCSVIFTE